MRGHVAIAGQEDAERTLALGVAYGHAPDWPVSERDLTCPIARQIWQAVERMRQTGVEPGDDIDRVERALMQQLRARGHLDALAHVEATSPPWRDEVRIAAGEVREASVRRRWRAVGRRIEDLAMDHERSVQDLVREIGSVVADAARDGGVGRGPVAIEERLRNLEHELALPLSERRLLSTPWPTLNSYIGGGLRGGALCIVGGRPGSGKSAFGLQWATHAAIHHGPVLFHSCEMDEQENAEREVAQHLQKNALELTSVDVERARRQLAGQCPLYIYTTNEGVADFEMRLAAFVAQHPDASAAFVDYLGLLAETGARVNSNAAVGHVSKRLKTAAMRHGIPLVALHQLSRSVEDPSRRDKRPMLSDLRDSGSLEQDANLVLFPFRPGYYDPNADPSAAEVIIAKQRRGKSRIACALRWIEDTLTFRDAAPLDWVERNMRHLQPLPEVPL